MFKFGAPNPLNVHGIRELSWCPPHFTAVPVSPHILPWTDERVVKNWIYENLQGRYHLGYTDTDQGRCVLAAFERASEASYFSLMAHTILESM
jgi:hypothetical protein